MKKKYLFAFFKFNEFDSERVKAKFVELSTELSTEGPTNKNTVELDEDKAEMRKDVMTLINSKVKDAHCDYVDKEVNKDYRPKADTVPEGTIVSWVQDETDNYVYFIFIPVIE